MSTFPMAAPDPVQPLVLIRHSLPKIQPELPAAKWQLSDEGWQRARELGDHLQGCGLKRMIASEELKAVQTAQAVAARLGIPWESHPGLEEHHRETVRHMPRADFQALVARLLEHPQERVFGEETGAQALQRFSTALQALLDRHPGESLGVVTHGTVLSLWAAQTLGLPAVQFWKQLGLPAFLIIRRGKVWSLDHIESITGGQAAG